MFTNGLDVLDPGTVIENIHMCNYPSVSENPEKFREYLNTEVLAGHLLRSKVGDGPQPSRTVPVAFIPKPGQPGKFRLISDASAPLGHSTNYASPLPPHFRMVSPSDIFARSDSSTWGTITDADCAFRQLPLNPLHAGLMAIEFDGFYYWELRAPFGWRLAPFSWCRLTSIIQRYCAWKGHNICVYVDDFFGMGQSESAANYSQDFLIELLLVLGLRDKPSKRLHASQVVPFIGFIFNFADLSISISPERSLEILTLVEKALASPRIKASELASLAGKLIFVSQVVLGARTFTRRLFDVLSPTSNSRITLSPALAADLHWWARFLRTFNGQKVVHWSVHRPVARCCTDASDLAACGVGPSPTACWVHAWTSLQSNWHINVRELWAVYHSLLTWGARHWANHDVVFAVDNSVAVSWINSGTARSSQAMSLLRKIFWLTASLNIRITAVWIPTGLNYAADAGSRLDFTRLHQLTGILPFHISFSGLLSTIQSASPFIYITPSLADHQQTLLRLNPRWPSWLSRVYSPRWQTLRSPVTEAPGSPSFGFSWPTSGLPSRFSKSFSSVMPHGCGSVGTPMPPSELTSALCPPSTLPWESNFPWQSLRSQPWHVACAEFDVLSAHLKVRHTLPSKSWSPSGSSSTSVISSSWPAGPLSAWVSSPSFDPGIWFRSLKVLGNPAPTSRVAMSVLLSGVPSFTSVSPKQASLMGRLSPFPSQSFLEPVIVPSLPLNASLPSFKPLTHRPYFRSDTLHGSRIVTSEFLSAISPKNVASTRANMVATAPAVVVPRLRPPWEALPSTSSFKVYGSPMPTFVTSTCPLTKGGHSLRSWRQPLPLAR